MKSVRYRETTKQWAEYLASKQRNAFCVSFVSRALYCCFMKLGIASGPIYGGVCFVTWRSVFFSTFVLDSRLLSFSYFPSHYFFYGLKIFFDIFLHVWLYCVLTVGKYFPTCYVFTGCGSCAWSRVRVRQSRCRHPPTHVGAVAVGGRNRLGSVS